jgi:hypothetical protein
MLIFYALTGALTGQTSAQEPQSMHLPSSITYLPSPSAIQLWGHSPSHAPQEMHSSVILYAIAKTPSDKP